MYLIHIMVCIILHTLYCSIFLILFTRQGVKQFRFYHNFVNTQFNRRELQVVLYKSIHYINERLNSTILIDFHYRLHLYTESK